MLASPYWNLRHKEKSVLLILFRILCNPLFFSLKAVSKVITVIKNIGLEIELVLLHCFSLFTACSFHILFFDYSFLSSLFCYHSLTFLFATFCPSAMAYLLSLRFCKENGQRALSFIVTEWFPISQYEL